MVRFAFCRVDVVDRCTGPIKLTTCAPRVEPSAAAAAALDFPVFSVYVARRQPHCGGRYAALPISGPRSTEICLLSHIINEFIVFVRMRTRAVFCLRDIIVVMVACAQIRMDSRIIIVVYVVCFSFGACVRARAPD